MAIYFDMGKCFGAYDRNYVKDVYALKQQTNTKIITRLMTSAEPETDAIILSNPLALSNNYYNNLAKDYIDGRITEAEFYGHLEDIYYSKGGWSDELTQEEKQGHLNSIVQNAHNGIINYYMKLNRDEWETEAMGAEFFYNTDYHYMFLEETEKYIQGSNALVEKLDLNSVEEKLRTHIRTVNGRMSVMLAGHAGRFTSLEVAPPPGMKIAIYTREEQKAVIICDGVKYEAELPFSHESYDKSVYKFALADIFADYDIPEKFREFINNITAIKLNYAHYSRDYFMNRQSYNKYFSQLWDAVAQYDKTSIFLP